MKRPSSLTALGRLVLLCVCTLLTACGPEDFVLWAPDGEHAIVRGDLSMMIDPTGRSIGVPVGESEIVLAWMPDSRRVIITRLVPAKSWEEYSALLGTERTEFIGQMGEQLAALITGYHADWRRFPTTSAVKNWTQSLEYRGEDIENVAYYLEQTHPGLVAPLVEAARQIAAAHEQENAGAPKDPEREGDESLIREDQLTRSIVEIRLRQAIPLDPAADQLLVRVPDSVEWACAAPSGRVIAFARQEPGIDCLYVLPVTPGGALPVLVDKGAGYAAWSPDGQSLAYAKSTTPHNLQQGSVQLGTITGRRVCGADGNVIAEADAAEDFAGIILPERPARVAWIPDGRILFAGATLTLPVTLKDMPQGLALFALRLQPDPVVERLTPASIDPDLLQGVSLFTVSPDGRNVAILGKSGAVSVFGMASGTFTTLQGPIAEFDQ